MLFWYMYLNISGKYMKMFNCIIQHTSLDIREYKKNCLKLIYSSANDTLFYLLLIIIFQNEEMKTFVFHYQKSLIRY